MKKVFLQLFFALVCFIWGKYWSGDDLTSELTGISIGLCIAILIEIIDFVIRERAFLGLYFKSYFFSPNKELRFSIAYLFKIEHLGKYLLVKNKRFETPTYQPVGGVYKYFNPEVKEVFNKLTIIPDTSIEIDNQSQSDLRVKMLKRKHLRGFLKWFFENKNRETNPWREFYEELVVPNYLPKTEFSFIYSDLVGQHFEKIHPDKHFNSDTFKYSDIYSPRLVNEEQKLCIKHLANKHSEDFIWVTEKEIRNKVSKCGRRISDHAHKIFVTQKLNVC